MLIFGRDFGQITLGFTPLTAELTPRQMVEVLNEVYSWFDSLVEEQGVEKIRTIGAPTS